MSDKQEKSIQPRRRSGLLKKLLVFMVATLLLNAFLIAGLFTYTSRNVFANMKAEELVPKALFISRLVSQYQRYEITERTLESTLMSDMTLWDATLNVFSSDGDIIAHSVTPESDDTQRKLRTYLSSIVDGEIWRLVQFSPELGIVVGVPVYGLDASVTGAVFLTKPLKEVNTALSGLNTALIISSIIVLLIILLPAYIGSRGFTRPLMQMSQAAKAMAAGNFSIRADDTRKDEAGELGQSLNRLSTALSGTISDLMLERNRLRNVLDSLAEGVIAFRANNSVSHINPAAIRLLRLDNESVQKAWDVLVSLMPNGELCDCNAPSFEGIELCVMVTGLIGPDGEAYGNVVTLRDITEETRLEQTRRDYVANVSHELKTPIASIRGLSEALSDGMVKNEKDKTRYYGYILKESLRLSRLIDDLLELSRLQTGLISPVLCEFNICPVLSELCESFHLPARDRGKKLTLDLPARPIIVCSNTDRVEQILICLLDNALKYSSGDIKVSAELAEDEAQIKVISEGAIEQKHLESIFERFYKADESHSQEGTGLGLSIARELTHILKGRIWAQNENESAVFILALPTELENQNPAPSA